MAVFRNLSEHIKGDTWSGLDLAVTDGDGNAKDLTGATIRMKFRYKEKTGTEMDERTSGAGEITITNAVGGLFSIDKFDIDWAPGTYFWDIEITFSNGDVKTPFMGTLPVAQDVTYT